MQPFSSSPFSPLPAQPGQAAPIEPDPIARAALIRRITFRLVPFLFFLYVIAYLDRVNVSVAKLQMKPDLHFSDAVYGLGTGIFFLGYFLFEVPSNLIMVRVGARRWIARIMFTWGLFAIAMLFTRDAASFYTLRFLLGIAEAGFFPGVILYLTYWFTRPERGRIIALFMTANMIAQIVGSPISGMLLNVHGGGLKGWQWLFLLEGIPAVLLTFVVLSYLPNGPKDARWLGEEEKQWLTSRLQVEDAEQAEHGVSLFRALTNPRVVLMSVLYFTLVNGMYGYAFWLPSLIKSFGKISDAQVGWLTALPYLATAGGMVIIGAHSDRMRERRLHVAIPAFIASMGLLSASLLVHSPIFCMLALTVAAISMWGTLGPFWGLSTSFLAGSAAAGAIALINSIGNLGGFVGSYLVGYLDPTKNGFAPGLRFLALSLFLASLLAFATRKEK